MRLDSFEHLYIDELNDLYSAERQLIQALPKMAQAASTPELEEAFANHLEQTKGHAEIVKQLLSAVGEKAGGEKCKGMEGLLKEGEEIIEKRGEPDVKDAALISAAQRVEHYEIAGYGTARAYAEQLGNNDAVDQLQQILDQEHTANDLLTKLATGKGGTRTGINQKAMNETQSSGKSKGR
jgi:ferritin-like metal-binding protein YciE